jgi:DNA-binding SARP family transcriptional activator
MIAALQQRRRLPTFTRALVSLALLLALWLFHPNLPSLPRSFSAPLTIETIEGLTVWLLWLVGALLAFAILLTPRQARTRLSVAAVPRSRGTSSFSPRRARSPRSQPPLLVVLSPKRAQDAQAHSPAAALDQPSPVERAASAPDTLALPTRPQISMLGPLTITGAKQSRRGLRARALELIAYLALHPRPVQRDELLEAFWPSADPRLTRPRLRQAVRDARRLLGSAIASERDRYWLDRDAVDIDLDQLERLLSQARGAKDDNVGRRFLEQALALFTDEPLAGSDYPWAEGELRRLRATQVELLEQVGRNRLAGGEPGRALELAERALALDGLNEGLWRLALQAESTMGLREAIDERYERLRALLAERLGLEPDRETRSLHRTLLKQG